MKFDLHMIQLDREICEVPGCKWTEKDGNIGLDWDHCIFKKNNSKKKYHDFTYNPFNMLRACAICNRITHISDHWEAKEWLINFHMDGEYRDEFLEWISDPPSKIEFSRLLRIYNYIATKLDQERN